jgi:pimeloyl-ACP methyl ester carboxylesterase
VKWIPSRIWKKLVRTLVVLLTVYVAVVLVLLALEDRLVFRPSQPGDRWRESAGDCAFQDEYLQTAGGQTIHARWFPCPGAHGAALFCHDRSANLSICWPAREVERWHRETGLSVLLFDYPGYGRSSGAPSERGCSEAADTAYNWLTEEQKIAPGEVLLVGRSLGTAVAVDLASRRPHRALVLIGSFTSIPDVAQTRFPFLPARLLMRNRFDSAGRIGRSTRPVLIVHGTKDVIVPFCLGQQLFEAAHQPRRLIVVPGAGHDDSVLAGFFPELRRFLDEYAP